MEPLTPNPFTGFIFNIFIACAIIIIAYTCNFYYLAFLSGHRKENYDSSRVGEPTVTIHLPIYNEKGKVMKGPNYSEPNLKQFVE